MKKLLLFFSLISLSIYAQKGYDIQALTEVDPAAIKSMVKQLAANDFKTRNKAQKELLKLPYPALELIEKSADMDDPEINLRIKEISKALKAKATSYKTQYLSWTTIKDKEFKRATKEWHSKYKPRTANPRENVAYSGHEEFAQSFIPRTNKIDAISVAFSPTEIADGWVSLDIHKNDHGKINPQILSSCWIRM